MTATSAPDPLLRRRRIGVLGGMFDPVHFGHLQAARLARERCGLDEVRLVPCGQPVHRPAAVTPAAERCAMVALAAAAEPWLLLDSRECDSDAPSRTWTTLQSLQAELPDCDLYCILGMDAFLSLPSWYRWRELFDLAHLVVIRRPESGGSTEEPGEELAAACAGRWVQPGEPMPAVPAGAVILVPQASRPLSSTEVREALRQGREVGALLPAAVANYIHAQHLYQQNGVRI